MVDPKQSFMPHTYLAHLLDFRGARRHCKPEISDELTFVKLSNGMVLPKRMVKDMGIL